MWGISGGMDPSGEEVEEEIAEFVGDGELRADGENVMHFKNLNGILGISIRDGGFRHWVAVKPSPVS